MADDSPEVLAAPLRTAPPSPCSSPICCSSSGIEPEIVAAADTIEAVPGFGVPVARLAHLVALKVLARDDRTRPHDRVDLAARLDHADSAARQEAREALTLVTRRGYSRTRDLLAMLQATVDEFRR